MPSSVCVCLPVCVCAFQRVCVPPSVCVCMCMPRSVACVPLSWVGGGGGVTLWVDRSGLSPLRPDIKKVVTDFDRQ